MHTKRVMDDVSLSSITLTQELDVVLDFLSTYDGRQVAAVRCIGINVFNLTAPPDSPFPHFIGEVNVATIGQAELRNELLRLRYQFRGNGDEPSDFSEPVDLRYLHAEGDIMLKVLCAKIVGLPPTCDWPEEKGP